MNWKIYIIQCSDNTLYTGITTDIEKRFNMHLNGKGAKYFNFHSPEKIVYLESNHTRSSATKREREIKKMNKKQKEILINSILNKKTNNFS